MNGSWSRNNEKDNKQAKEGEGSGWSTFFKVAGAVAATAAVAGSLYSIRNQAPHGVQQTHHRDHHDEEEEEEEEEVVILHVDGSLKRDKQSAGCGGYLSSSSQNWIRGFVQKLEFTSTLREDQTEKEAILRGLRWVLQTMGMRKVAVNSDCKTVVDFVNDEAPTNDPLIRGIRYFLDSDDWEATLSWIPRTKNEEADKLSKKAHSCRSLELHQSTNRSYLLNLNNQIGVPHIWYE